MCGIFGIVSKSINSAQASYMGLYSLQHRGQESAGIAISDGKRLSFHKDMGLVENVFSDKTLRELKGYMAIGHTRYSTSGQSHLLNSQPIVVNCKFGKIALGHNGNLTNQKELRKKLVNSGAIFQSSVDSETIVHLISKSKADKLEDAVIETAKQLKGAFSCVILSKDKIIAFRDPEGYRPLSLGKINSGYCISSETCSFNQIDAEHLYDIEPAEIVILDENGIKKNFYTEPEKRKQCIFELIYLARPDSNTFGYNNYLARRIFGEIMANEYPVDADLVVPIPDSGVPAAMGYAAASGIPYELGLLRNHFVGRTFIEPSQPMRSTKVKIKLNPIKEVINKKDIVLIDDSIVRGTTSKEIVKMLRDAGAKKVHMRISSPPIVSPCFYGIDTPDKTQLIAANNSVEEIRKYIGADSLHFLSVEGLIEQFPEGKKNDFCLDCFH